MTSNPMIDVTIGLILMYLVLSLICTTINELIANAFSIRAKTLRSGLERLIDDKRLLSQFNDHGLIDGLRTMLKGDHPSYLSSSTFAAAILDSLDPIKPLPDLASVQNALKALPPSNIKDALQGAMTSGVKDIETLRGNVASWFDQMMDRLSGIFKRYMQWISFGVGLAVAVSLNADSTTVAIALWTDNALRTQIADAATEALSKTGSGDTKTQLEDLGAQIERVRAQLRPLPIGWSDVPARPDHNWLQTWSGRGQKLFGWLITAFAIMLGAPFWFDLLGRFVQLRGAGEKPKEAASSNKPQG
jgi:hypothetical protein